MYTKHMFSWRNMDNPSPDSADGRAYQTLYIYASNLTFNVAFKIALDGNIKYIPYST